MPKKTNQRDLLLQTAIKLFGRHGYKGTTVDMITTEAGVSHGLLYNFFPAKEDLLRELLAMAFLDIQKSMAPYASNLDPEKAIEGHVLSVCKIIKERSDFWRLLHAIRLQEGVPGVLMGTYRDIVTYVSKVFEGVFKKLGYEDPRLEAILFLSQIDGIVIMYLQDDHTPIDRLATQLIKRYKS